MKRRSSGPQTAASRRLRAARNRPSEQDAQTTEHQQQVEGILGVIAVSMSEMARAFVPRRHPSGTGTAASPTRAEAPTTLQKGSATREHLVISPTAYTTDPAATKAAARQQPANKPHGYYATWGPNMIQRGLDMRDEQGATRRQRAGGLLRVVAGAAIAAATTAPIGAMWASQGREMVLDRTNTTRRRIGGAALFLAGATVAGATELAPIGDNSFRARDAVSWRPTREPNTWPRKTRGAKPVHHNYDYRPAQEAVAAAQQLPLPHNPPAAPRPPAI